MLLSTLKRGAVALYHFVSIIGVGFQYIALGYFLIQIYGYPTPDQPRLVLIILFAIIYPYMIASCFNGFLYAWLFNNRTVLYINLVWTIIIAALYLI